tara:strand:- start:107 stop:991 length:885 start_codon:yes stop_codon:yes gene_type:complete
MILASHGLIASQIASASLLLDLYPSAAAAYSVRKLRTLYTGSAIRVRNASNAEQDIGFTALGNLDTTALLSHCGSGNGFVTTWYDQSGNARNATQSTAANQPQIVSSGSVLTVNSKPCTVFSSSSSTRLNVSSNFWTYTGNSTVFHASLNTHTSYQSLISYFEGVGTSLGVQYNKYPNAATNVSTDVYGPGGMATDTTQSSNTQYLVCLQWQNWSTHKTNGNTIIAINGANQAISAYGINPSAWANNGVTRIGAFDNAGFWDGKIQELVIYTTALSGGNIDGAESNINTYYAIY